MANEIKLLIDANGEAEVFLSDEQLANISVFSKSDSTDDSDLVKTTAEKNIKKATRTVVISLKEVASTIFDVVEELSKEAKNRELSHIGKTTISFGVSGGLNADLKIVSGNAESFMTVQVEIN